MYWTITFRTSVITFQYRKTEFLDSKMYLWDALAIGSEQTAQDCIETQEMTETEAIDTLRLLQERGLQMEEPENPGVN